MRAGLAAACVVSLGGLGVVAACSLGLDESLLNPKTDGGGPFDSPSLPSDTGVDTGLDAPPSDSATGCTTNAQCVGQDKCHVGTCDPTMHVCTFAVCPTTQACTVSACNAGTCGAPQTVRFLAGTFPLAQGLGICGSPSACLAAAYPFFVVGEQAGVSAYVVADPVSPPAKIPVNGIGFAPVLIRASGQRVFFLGNLVASTPSNKLPVAWVDVPSDPTVPSLTATSVLELVADGVNKTWPGPDGTLYAQDSANAFFTILTPPLADGATLNFYQLPNFPGNDVASSGSRLVSGRWDATSLDWFFSLEQNAGTAGATNLGEQNGSGGMGPMGSQASFTQGDDGSVLIEGASIGGDPEAGTRWLAAARAAWILAGSSSSQFDSSAHVDLETYANQQPLGPNVAGPLAWIDASTALAVALAQESFASDGGFTPQASVQVVKKSGATASLVSGRRDLLGLDPGSTLAFASGGYAYVLTETPVDGGATSLAVRIYAPACGP